MKPDEVSKFDQSAAFLTDSLPPLWWQMYKNCVKEGFTEEQALYLVRAYVHGTAGGALEKPR